MTLNQTKPVVGPEPVLHSTARIRDSVLGEWVHIGAETSIVESTIGDYTYLVDSCQVIYSEIGKFCSIASHSRINPGNHPLWRVTSHHMTYRRRAYGLGDEDDQEFFDWRRADAVKLGHDVWLGHGAIICAGVTIGNGAAIGAGAVVTKDVAPYMVVGGVPAKPIKERFPRHIWERIERIAWWDWSRDQIEDRVDDLVDLERFLERYE